MVHVPGEREASLIPISDVASEPYVVVFGRCNEVELGEKRDTNEKKHRHTFRLYEKGALTREALTREAPTGVSRDGQTVGNQGLGSMR